MDLYALQYWSYTICLLFTVLVLIVTLTRPASKQQKLVLISSFVILMIMIGYWGSVSTRFVAHDLIVFVTKLEYMGVGLFYITLLFIFRFFLNFKIPRPLLISQITITIVLTAVASSFDKHHLFFSTYHVQFMNGSTTLIRTPALFQRLYVIMMMFYMIIFTTLVILACKRGTKAERKTAIILFITYALPCLCYVLEGSLDIQPLKIVPFGMLGSSICLLILITIGHFGDVNSIARDIIFENIEDAIITVDNSMHLVKFNKQAAKLFPFLEDVEIGDRLEGKDELFEKVFAPLFDRDETFPLDYRSGEEIYQPEIKPLFGRKGKLQGSVLWLYDVTDEREYSKKLERELSLRTNKILDMQDKMIIGFAKLVENRDTVTGKHLERTSSYVLIIGMHFMNNGLFPEIVDDRWVETLRKVAPLHDIGKVSIPDGILNKPGKLTDDEFALMKRHTIYGDNIIENILKDSVDEDYYAMAKDVARHHHERWDGRGYPDGLSGEAIPLSARVMAVADVFDALVTPRPYKPAFPPDEAFKILEESKGTQFDPVCVEAFMENKDFVLKIFEELSDDGQEPLEEVESI